MAIYRNKPISFLVSSKLVPIGRSELVKLVLIAVLGTHSSITRGLTFSRPFIRYIHSSVAEGLTFSRRLLSKPLSTNCSSSSCMTKSEHSIFTYLCKHPFYTLYQTIWTIRVLLLITKGNMTRTGVNKKKYSAKAERLQEFNLCHRNKYG